MADAAEEAQFELDVGDAEATEVELEQPEEKDVPRGTSEPEIDVVEEVPANEDSEVEQYSESVQKRINRLTKKMRDAEREREEALQYAKNVQTEAEKVRQRMQTLDQGFMNEYGQRISIQQQQAEANLRRAVELGDPDGTVQAQKELTSLTIAADGYAKAQRQAEARASQPQQPMAQPAPQAAPPQPQRPDPKAEQWAEKNSWFGNDEAMTFAAFGIHKNLLRTKDLILRAMTIIMSLTLELSGSFRINLEKDNPLAANPLKRWLASLVHLGAVKGSNSPRPK